MIFRLPHVRNGKKREIHLSVLQLLRCSKVVLLCIHKVTGDHVADGHLRGEGDVGLDGGAVRGVDEFGGGHVVDAGDGADGCGVT